MGSRRGGVDIEAVALEEPSAIVTQPLPLHGGFRIDDPSQHDHSQ